MLCLFRTVFISISLVFAASSSALAANWYVDKNATGANNGTSWANAWNELDQIGWPSVNPGDTIYLSGGNYTRQMVPSKSGAPNAPITVRASQEPGHNSLVVISNNISGGNLNWFVIDGARNDNYGSTWITNTINVPMVPDNCGISIRAQNAINFSGHGPVGLKLRWLDIQSPDPGVRDHYGIRISSSGGTMSSNEFAFLYIHDIGQDGLHSASGNTTNFDAVTLHHCYMPRIGDDPIEWTVGGLTMHHNYISDGSRQNGHGDGLQSVGGYYRIYNNIIYDMHNAALRLQANYIEGSVTTDIHVYGNLIYTDDQNAVGAEHISLLTYGNYYPVVTNLHWKNFYFLNNTVARVPSPSGAFTHAKRANYLNINISGFRFQNNIFWHNTNNPAIGVHGDESNGWNYNQSQYVFDYNIVSGPAQQIGYDGTNYDSGNALSAATLYKQNDSSPIQFINAASHDYRLALGDTAARNTGVNLSSLNLPGFDRDLYGNLRGNDGAWDRGANEGGAATPVLPGTFNLSNPASVSGAGVSMTPVLNWTASSSASSYTIEISSSSVFSQPLIHAATTTALGYNVPTNVLALETTYFWRVKAVNSAGTTFAANSPLSFTTATGSGDGSGGSENVSTNGLLVWLKFDDDFSDSKLEDASGNGNHGHRFGRIGSAYPTNFPKRMLATSAAGTAFRTNLTSSDYAGDFMWYNTGHGLYGREGDYVGITNGITKMTNMATATIMCWARYKSAPAGYDYTVDANSTLLSAGTSAGVPGSWDFGRYNQKIALNNTRFYFITNQSTFAKTVIEFPDRGFDQKGNTTNWQHYAITWDNGVVKGYLNGKPFVTNDSSAVVTTLKVGRNPNVASPWIGIGCNTHAGTPHLDDEAPNIEYPNHGWLNGAIDDVRIYERVLSAAEVQAIVSGNVSGPVEPELPARPTGLRLALP